MSSVRRLISIIILLSCLAVVSSFLSVLAEAYPLTASAGERVSLPDAARSLGVTTHWRPAEGKLLLTHKERSAEVLIGTGRVNVGGYPMSLASSVIASNDTVTILLADAAVVFTRLLGREVTEKEISDSLAAGRPVTSSDHDEREMGIGRRDAADFFVQPRAWAEPQPKQTPFTTVVIDPGHGGKDQGARGRGGLPEKDVALSIALKLKERIEADGMRVVLTRADDSFVSLRERTVIANHAKNGGPADLFISIHTNSHVSPGVEGFEAYYVSDAIDPGAEATAALENAVAALEDEGETGGSSVTNILWDLQYAEFIADSSEFAFMTQEELGKRLNTRDRGVRQARFIVLAGAAMPSVLVEVGFISNRGEEAKLKTEDYKNDCAGALAAAVAAFKKRYETKLGLLNGGQARDKATLP